MKTTATSSYVISIAKPTGCTNVSNLSVLICFLCLVGIKKFDVHRAVHRNIISTIKPTRCTNVSKFDTLVQNQLDAPMYQI